MLIKFVFIMNYLLIHKRIFLINLERPGAASPTQVMQYWSGFFKEILAAQQELFLVDAQSRTQCIVLYIYFFILLEIPTLRAFLGAEAKPRLDCPELQKRYFFLIHK